MSDRIKTSSEVEFEADDESARRVRRIFETFSKDRGGPGERRTTQDAGDPGDGDEKDEACKRG